MAKSVSGATSGAKRFAPEGTAARSPNKIKSAFTMGHTFLLVPGGGFGKMTVYHYSPRLQ